MFNLGEKLKQAREESGLDQKSVASALNTDQGKISLIEKNARKVDAEKELPKFANLYKKPISWFYEDLNEVPEDKSTVDDFLNIYFKEYNFNAKQKKTIEKLFVKTLKNYISDLRENYESLKSLGLLQKD